MLIITMLEGMLLLFVTGYSIALCMTFLLNSTNCLSVQDEWNNFVYERDTITMKDSFCLLLITYLFVCGIALRWWENCMEIT